MWPKSIVGCMVWTLTLVLCLYASPARGEEIVLATWGGGFGQAFQRSWADPFEKATGIKVKMIFGGSASNKQRIVAERNTPQIDVITLVDGDAYSAYESGVLASIDVNAMPNAKQLVPLGIKRMKDGGVYQVGTWAVTFGLVYRTDKIDWDVNSWKDLWNPKLKDKVALPTPKFDNASFLAIMNKIEGGPPHDASKGIAKLKTLGRNVVLEYDSSVVMIKEFAQGETWAVPTIDFNGRQMIKEGIPAKFILPSEGAGVSVTGISLVKNGPNPSGAAKFINYILDKTPAEAICKEFELFCLNKQATGQIISEGDLKRFVNLDELNPTINDNKGRWLEQWIREITPLSKR